MCSFASVLLGWVCVWRRLRRDDGFERQPQLTISLSSSPRFPSPVVTRHELLSPLVQPANQPILILPVIANFQDSSARTQTHS